MPNLVNREMPPEATTQARRILRKALANPAECGDRGYALGWILEAHTVGCVSDAIPDDKKLDILYTLFLQYVNDSRSVVMGDPGEGAFVSATEVADTQYQIGASDLIELGRRGNGRHKNRYPGKSKRK